jgi:hypothetical protein
MPPSSELTIELATDARVGCRSPAAVADLRFAPQIGDGGLSRSTASASPRRGSASIAVPRRGLEPAARSVKPSVPAVGHLPTHRRDAAPLRVSPGFGEEQVPQRVRRPTAAPLFPAGRRGRVGRRRRARSVAGAGPCRIAREQGRQPQLTWAGPVRGGHPVKQVGGVATAGGPWRALRERLCGQDAGRREVPAAARSDRTSRSTETMRTPSWTRATPRARTTQRTSEHDRPGRARRKGLPSSRAAPSF